MFEGAGNSVLIQRLGQAGLLLNLVSAFVIPPFFGGSTVFLQVFVMLSLGFGLMSVSQFRIQFLFLLPLVLLQVFATVQLMINEAPRELLFFYGASLLFFGAMIGLFLTHFFRQTRVDGTLLLASINIYFALGVMFAMIYGLIDHFLPGSFSVSASEGALPDSVAFMYFSLVTLSTLGYGDILPLSDQARTIASIEALAGQIYLTIAVARLVGLHISRSEM